MRIFRSDSESPFADDFVLEEISDGARLIIMGWKFSFEMQLACTLQAHWVAMLLKLLVLGCVCVCVCLCVCAACCFCEVVANVNEWIARCHLRMNDDAFIVSARTRTFPGSAMVVHARYWL